ncbi:MAG: ferredoxin family protein [Candidatus Eisenbacteria bacterium]|nr:ferredoxin family protein [Candidatus Eisenbacteria bacterium]MCC7144048.1 ferredoxin family protein [Candidatus Eisenbacteria bacterium]
MSEPTRGPKGRVEIKSEECKGCGTCVELCPQDVLLLGNDLNRMGYRAVTYKGDGCTGCGICFYACPEPGALSVYKIKDKALA